MKEALCHTAGQLGYHPELNHLTHILFNKLSYLASKTTTDERKPIRTKEMNPLCGEQLEGSGGEKGEQRGATY